MQECLSEKGIQHMNVLCAEAMSNARLLFTEELVETYLRRNGDCCTNRVNVSKNRNAFNHLKRWLSDDTILTADRLKEWKNNLEINGYSKSSIQTYVKHVNSLLRWAGYEELCIPRVMHCELQGKKFGYLTAIEPTSKRHRKDIIWSCICKCGKKVEVPATFLMCGVTTSCGCIRSEHFRYTNRLVENTSLRRVLKDDAVSRTASSGYTGVTFRYGKWTAVIEYKKKRYFLGNYEKLEDAVAARAEAKAWVVDDAKQLEEQYAFLWEEKSVSCNVPQRTQTAADESSTIYTRRNDNTSGYTGVGRKRDSWTAKINYRGIRYYLGVYETMENAVAVRKEAEKYAAADDIRKLEELSKRQRMR